jgi:hypothetical protein
MAGDGDEIYRVEISRSSTGIAIHERWTMDGKLHRLDGPAMITRSPVSGTVTEEGWFRHGKLHRDDGAAYIKRKPDTERVYYSVWYQHGKHIVPPRRGTPRLTKDRPSGPGPVP